jgi:hypothetical protein
VVVSTSRTGIACPWSSCIDGFQPKTHVSAYKAAQGPGQTVLQPVREKDLRLDSVARSGARFTAHSPRPD